MENLKICPLNWAQPCEWDRIVSCLGERCAWYVPPAYAPNGKLLTDGRCAVRVLGALPDLAAEVKRL